MMFSEIQVVVSSLGKNNGSKKCSDGNVCSSRDASDDKGSSDTIGNVLLTGVIELDTGRAICSSHNSRSDVRTLLT